MLVLSRQKSEAIMIGDDVEIVVVDIRRDRVRIGINAPENIPVHRKEVYEAIRRENIEASKTKLQDLSGLEGLLGGKKAPPEEPEKKDRGGEEKDAGPGKRQPPPGESENGPRGENQETADDS